jgi:hypothetical protein
VLLTWLLSAAVVCAEDSWGMEPAQAAEERPFVAYDQSDEGPGDVHGPGSHGEEHAGVERAEPFQHRHETRDGYPILEVLKTDHAFLERKVRMDVTSTQGKDDGSVEETEFNGELFWALGNRLAVVVESPLIARNPADARSTTGVGDSEFGMRFVAFNGETSILTFGLNVLTPTGDSDRELGEGHTALEPVALLWHDLGGGNAFQGELAVESPMGVAESEAEFRYNFALSHTLRSTEHLCFFHWLTPFVELNGQTMLNGDSSGRTVVNLTPGLRWAVNEENHAALGFSVPLSGVREYDSQLILSWCHHF